MAFRTASALNADFVVALRLRDPKDSNSLGCATSVPPAPYALLRSAGATNAALDCARRVGAMRSLVASIEPWIHVAVVGLEFRSLHTCPSPPHR